MTTPLTGIQGTAVVFLREANAYMASGYAFLCLEKSFISASGPFAEITAAAVAAATFTGTKKETFTLGTNQFDFYANNALQSVIFAGETVSAAVAAAISAQTIAVAVASAGAVKISSPTTGLASTLEVKASTDAGVELGFSAGDYDIGEAARLALVTDQLLYTWDDYNCDDAYFYRARLYNSVALTYSGYFTVFQARPASAVPPTSLIWGTLQLVDSEGIPLVGKLVTVKYRRLGAVGTKVVDGPMYKYYSDSDGFVDICLVKSSKIRVAVADTRLVRDITAPSTGSSFALFDPSVQQFDELGVASYQIDDLPREAF